MPEQHLRIVGQLHGIVCGIEQGKVLGNAKAGALLQPPDQGAAHDAQQGMLQEQAAPARDGPALSRHEGGTHARRLLPGDGLDASGNGLEFGLCRIPLQAQRFVLERRQGLGGLALVAHHAQAQVALQLQAVALRAHLQHQAFAAQADDKVLNIYSARHYPTDEALYADFTKSTGIKINRIDSDDAGILTRLKAEGAASPADVILLVDAARLWRAEVDGLFLPVKSKLLEESIPDNLRAKRADNGGIPWFGLSTRARVIVYDQINCPKKQGQTNQTRV